MAHDSNLPCDGNNRCMICKIIPPVAETLTCNTCVTPWHVNCLSVRPETLAEAAQWQCPDCSDLVCSHAPQPSVTVTSGSETSDSLIAAIRAIEADASLSDQEKARRRQKLLSGGGSDEVDDSIDAGKEIGDGGDNDVMKLFSGNLKCSFCMQMPERPVTVLFCFLNQHKFLTS